MQRDGELRTQQSIVGGERREGTDSPVPPDTDAWLGQQLQNACVCMVSAWCAWCWQKLCVVGILKACFCAQGQGLRSVFGDLLF